jgi:hypothetical protein
LETFHEFVRCLESLEWEPRGHFDTEVLTILAEVGGRPRLISEAVNSWTTKSLEVRQLSCHETSTHYKWFMFYHKEHHFKIWLHQYKSASERRLGHAEVPHNHRYSLASVILNGGFVHHYFDRMNDILVESTRERRRFDPGDTYMVAWQRVHRLSELSDQTITLVVESPVVRNFSEAFYAESGKPRKFYDFVGLRARLAEELDSL